MKMIANLLVCQIFSLITSDQLIRDTKKDDIKI